MEDHHPIEKYRETVEPALLSKVEEFHMLGYNRATREELWKCLMSKKWKKREAKQLHEVVNDILTLSANVFIAYLSMEALKAPGWLMEDPKK